MDFFTCLSLLGYCLFISRFSRWPMEVLPFFVISLTIVLFYILAAFNLLKTGSAIYLVTGDLLLLTSPIYLSQERQKLLQIYFTPGILFMAAFLLIVGNMMYALIIINNDEINRWTPHIQFLYHYHHFWQANDPTFDKDYPPGGALFTYLFLKMGHFTEGHIYFSQLVLITAPFVILLKKFRSYYLAFLVASLTMMLFIKTLNVRPYILMDYPSGIFFGGILAAYFIMLHNRGFWLYLLFPTCALMIFKPMLYPFLLLIATIILCDQFLLRNHNQKNKLILFLMPIICILLLPLLFVGYWQYYSEHLGGTSIRYGLGILWEKFYTEYSPQSLHQYHLIVAKFLKNIPFHFVEFTLGLIALIFFLIENKIDRFRLIVAQSILLLGFIGYLFLLLLIYLFQISPQLALEMNSFDRFLSVYQLGWAFVVVAQGLYFVNYPFMRLAFISYQMSFNCNYFKSLIKVISIIYIGIFFTKEINYFNNDLEKNLTKTQNFQFVRYSMDKIARSIIQNTQPHSSINSLWGGGSNGTYLQYILIYSLFPRVVDIFYAKDGIVIPSLETKLTKANYIFIGYMEQAFWNKYGKYFPDRTPLTTISLCANDDITDMNNPTCKMHSIPVYLYKVILDKKGYQFINVAR